MRFETMSRLALEISPRVLPVMRSEATSPRDSSGWLSEVSSVERLSVGPRNTRRMSYCPTDVRAVMSSSGGPTG